VQRGQIIMSNITKFPINKTRPSDDMEQSMKFNVRAVMASEEFKQWTDDKISDYKFLNIMFEMLPGNKIPPSYDEFKLQRDEIMKVMASKEFKLLQENMPKDTP